MAPNVALHNVQKIPKLGIYTRDGGASFNCVLP